MKRAEPVADTSAPNGFSDKALFVGSVIVVLVAIVVLEVVSSIVKSVPTGAALSPIDESATQSQLAIEANTQEFQRPVEIVGTWVGTYECVQGKTALVLVITDADNRGSSATEINALFRFGPLESNPSVPEGDFTMTGLVTGDRFTLHADKWVRRPANYGTVDLVGSVNSQGAILSGDVAHPDCSSFVLRAHD